jgi:hypothetical protein
MFALFKNIVKLKTFKKHCRFLQNLKRKVCQSNQKSNAKPQILNTNLKNGWKFLPT